MYEFLQDKVHGLIIEAATAVLAHRDFCRVANRPGTQHTVSLMMNNSLVRVDLMLSFPEEQKPIGIPFMTEDALGPEYGYED